jgi:hypothetical protein
MGTLYYGDNLDILQRNPEGESVDLVGRIQFVAGAVKSPSPPRSGGEGDRVLIVAVTGEPATPAIAARLANEDKFQ